VTEVSFAIPTGDRQTLRDLARLPQDKLDRLLAAIRSAEPSLGARAAARSISDGSGIDFGEVSRYVQVIGAIGATLRELQLDYSKFDSELSEFVDPPATGARARAPAQVPPPLTAAELDTLRRFLLSALDSGSSVSLGSKGASLQSDVQRVFVRARILSDLRTVFGDSGIGKPLAAVILHTLRINYIPRGKDADERILIGLDLDDLKELKRVIDRAIEKDGALRSFYGDKLRVLE
jgi:hypothetical protein